METYPVPEEALREAVLNAVIHKDYTTGSPIQISVYEDKIMIWNDSQFPYNWTIEKLIAKHSSKPFNPDIEKVFFLSGMVEAWGRGIEKMITACKTYGVPEPVFRGETTGLWVEFKNHDAEMRKKLQKTEVLEKTHIKILEILALNPNMTIPELAQKIDKSESAVWRAVQKLQKEGYFKRIGPDKGGHWKVVKENKN